MKGDNKLTWGRGADRDLMARWPENIQGQPETPVFLCNCISNDMSDELRINMLEAYGIPCLRVYPGDGSFGKVVLGMSGPGTDIYVPESMLNDAKALCEEENNEQL